MDKFLKYGSIAITLLTLVIGGATGYAKLQSKVEAVSEKADAIGKVKEQAEDTEKRVVKIEVKIDGIDENLKEQKVNVRELKDDTKQILKALLEMKQAK